MTSAVILIVSLITLFTLGFRFDANDGDIEQYALLQFSSTPSGASVSVNGSTLDSHTPNKTSVPAGKYQVSIWRDGYETWQKSATVKSGTLTWLNYALLVPKKLTVESVARYESVYSSRASYKGNYIFIQKLLNAPVFDLVDISSDKIKTTYITLPLDLYSEPTTAGVTHTFSIEKWDDSERYILVRHAYANKNEWLEVDTQNVNLSKNITRLFDLSIKDILFSGNSGNTLYALESNDVRRLDLVAGTISKPLISNVTNFNIYNESKVLTYTGSGQLGKDEQVLGLYREGDDQPSIIRTVSGVHGTNLHIATTHYFNEDYVAVSNGKKVDVLSGSYPNNKSDSIGSMKVFATFNVEDEISKLTFSPSGEFLFIQSNANFSSYDLEYRKLAISTLEGSGSVFRLNWLDDNYIWSDRDDKLTIREFDGVNIHKINSIATGQVATLTDNGRYLYSISKTTKGYQLQRVRMILP